MLLFTLFILKKGKQTTPEIFEKHLCEGIFHRERVTPFLTVKWKWPIGKGIFTNTKTETGHCLLVETG